MSQQQATQTQSKSPELPALTDAGGRELTLLEMTRVMDVARTLRRERSVADQQLNLAETKKLLREKLLEAAKVAGDMVTPEEVDLAIEHYYENLHAFIPAEPGWQTTLAHLYVRRGPIFKWALAFAAGALLWWGMWFSGILPGGPRTTMQAESLHREVVVAAQTVEASSQIPVVKQQATDAIARADALRDARDLSGLELLRGEVQDQAERLNSEYQIVAVQGERSAVYRNFDGDTISGYYVLVQAVDANGNVLPQKIRNAEDGTVETVKVWGEQIPKSVFERLKADKAADGIVDDGLFATKAKGELEETVNMVGASGQPLERGRQITRW